MKKMISSYVGENIEFERQFLAGELEVEFCRRARSRNGCEPEAQAFLASTHEQGLAPWSQREKNTRNSTDDAKFLNEGFAPMWLW